LDRVTLAWLRNKVSIKHLTDGIYACRNIGMSEQLTVRSVGCRNSGMILFRSTCYRALITSENLTRILDRVILAWLRNKVSIKHLTTPRSLPTSFYCLSLLNVSSLKEK
jgi:hypothetical protein